MEIKLAIGLGNPGPEYKNTYHNVGQLFIDHLAGGGVNFKKKNSFEYLKFTNFLTLIKPLIFMNQSGGVVLNAKKYFNSKPAEILVVHDDSDIPLGSFKLSFGRGSAGHRGIESVIKSLKTNKFYRLRIGVRSTIAHRKPMKAGLPAVVRNKRTKAGELVLKKIPAKDMQVLKKLFEELRVLYFKTDGKRYAAHLRHNPGKG